MIKPWRKSSHSGGTAQTDCVEVAQFSDAVGFRDSKDPEGPKLKLSSHAARQLFQDIRSDKYAL